MKYYRIRRNLDWIRSCGVEDTWTFIATENEMDISYDGEYELVSTTTFTLNTETTP